MNKQERNRLIDTENILMVARWGGGMVKKVEGLRSTNCQLQNSHGDVKCSLGNVVYNILITMHGVRGVRDLLDDHLLSYVMSNHWGVHLKLI